MVSYSNEAENKSKPSKNANKDYHISITRRKDNQVIYASCGLLVHKTDIL